ncbi:uroporphyrinogen-III synthase [Gluconacetobacter azotocaptans]|uniref:Uroporphyrinogen-III synthase n=1 Tax=Gluconacetobacter azotocaptans TaxID=142834 RepID=A0A7W4PDJ6_9PROT|nr:uroporphyrinogen-III synthase [Gluconacetobacter azotocaptans]
MPSTWGVNWGAACGPTARRIFLPSDHPVGSGVLVTRPEPGLSETLAAVRALGWRPYAAPMLRIGIRPLALPGGRMQAVLLTSGQAIAALPGRIPPDMPILAVGEATARRAREAGFGDVTTAGGTAEALLGLARTRLDPRHGSLLLATARGYGGVLVSGLRQAGFQVSRRCVYTVEPVGRLGGDILDALAQGAVEAALFYSAETARQFLAALPPDAAGRLGGVRAVAISAATASALGGARWRAIDIADRPDSGSMLSRLGQYRQIVPG